MVEKPEPIHTILPSERLRMGVAHVRIGDETLSWEALHRLSTSDDPDQRPIVQLEMLEPLASIGPDDKVAELPDAKAFFELVNKAMAASASDDLLVYVHGSNNTVPRAAAQAAQLRHFTGRRMVVLAFLWPSAGSILKYFTDVANAQASVDPTCWPTAPARRSSARGWRSWARRAPAKHPSKCASGCAWRRSTLPRRTSTRAASCRTWAST